LPPPGSSMLSISDAPGKFCYRFKLVLAAHRPCEADEPWIALFCDMDVVRRIGAPQNLSTPATIPFLHANDLGVRRLNDDRLSLPLTVSCDVFFRFPACSARRRITWTASRGYAACAYVDAGSALDLFFDPMRVMLPRMTRYIKKQPVRSQLPPIGPPIAVWPDHLVAVSQCILWI
jgi:hypothetical protein